MFFRTFGNRLRLDRMNFSKGSAAKILPAVVALVLFFIVSAAYFAPQFRGEVLPQHDVLQYEGAPNGMKTPNGPAACSAACPPT